jgi:hypothetical protein
MKQLRRVVESLHIRVGSIVAGIPLIAGAVIGRWPNPWWAISVSAGAALIAVAVMGFALDFVPKHSAGLTPASHVPLRSIDLRPFVIWSPQPNGQFKPRLHMEAVNTGEHNLSLAQWTADQPGGSTVAGSPHEGRTQGPEILQPTQLHGWDIPLDTPGGTFRTDAPITVTVRLTTGEQFVTGPISLQFPGRPPA